MKYARLSLMALAAVLALPVFADTVDDCIKLAQGGVGEEVIVLPGIPGHRGDVMQALDLVEHFLLLPLVFVRPSPLSTPI